MKKLILSAAFVLACFSAKATNEVIKNDDDKNPKNKAKVVKAEAKDVSALLPGQFCATAEGSVDCGNGVTVLFESTVCGSNPTRAFLGAYGNVLSGMSGVQCN